jgi:hypothetical protein
MQRNMIIRLMVFLLGALLAGPVPADPPHRFTAASRPDALPRPARLPAIAPPRTGLPTGTGALPATGSAVRFDSGYRAQDAWGRRLEGSGATQGRGWELSPDGSTWRGTGTNFGRACPASPPGGSAFCP